MNKLKHQSLRHLFLLIVLGLVMSLAGCGSELDAQVSGQVTLDGVPLTRGTISFIPTADGAVAYATIRADGSYQIRTADNQGLQPGTYKVIIVATEPPPAGNDASPGTLITPARYGDVNSTPFEEQVSTGSNVLNFDIETQ